VDNTNSYEGWHPRIEHGNSYYGWQRRMGRRDDRYDEDSYEDKDDSFWDDYSSESESSGESNSSSEDSNELKTAPTEDSSIEIEEDKEYSSDESENDFWDEYSDESEKDSVEVNSYEAFSSDDSNEEGEDFWHSTSDEETEDFDSSQESERLQEAVDDTYTLGQYGNAYSNYYSQNTDLVTRIGEVDSLARTYSTSVDLPEVYTSLTDTSTVVRKIIQTAITWTSKNIGWIAASAAWSSLRGFAGGRALPKDTSRSIQLATAPNEALQEVFTIIGSGLFTILIWLVSTSYQSSTAEETDEERRRSQGSSQNLWWLNPEFASPEEELYKRSAFTGGSGLVTILDDMFGTEGTMDFLKDNFFESSGALLFWSLMGLLP